MNRILTAVILIGMVFSGCFWTDERVRGNRVIKTKSINVSRFSTINVSDAIQVYLKQDSVYSAVIEADENLIDFIDIDATYRYDLDIKEASGYRLKPSRSIKVYVTSPMVRMFDASGASGIFSENLLDADNSIYIKASGASNVVLNLNTETIKADASGASNINLKGIAKSIEVKASGASEIEGFNLTTTTATADASGASSIEIMCTQALHAEASAASTIRYKGNADVTKKVSAAASVNKADE